MIKDHVMINNGIARFLTSAKAVLGIILFIVALVVWFVAMNEKVADNTKQLEVNMPKVQENRESIIGMEKDISHIKDAVDKIYEKVK